MRAHRRLHAGAAGAIVSVERIKAMKRMMRIAAGVCLSLVGLACAGGRAARQAEPAPFQIHGVVVDAVTRQPAARVLIRLEEVNAGALTDEAGAFQVRGHARPGRYVMTVTRLGFHPRQMRVRIRGAGPVDVGTIAVRASVIQIDGLVAPD